MPDCLFCRILRKEIPSTIVMEDEEVLIFKDIHPKATTHLLIVPRQHVDSVQTLTDQTKGIAGMLVWKAKQLAERKGLRGYQLRFHVGREGGQEVYHLHLHLLSDQTLREPDQLTLAGQPTSRPSTSC